jgi:ParB/RepB/Spo0J family partition protein
MKIRDIRVGIRFRKDVGDIAGLAASIEEIGLLHPIVVRPDGLLIAGERCLRAAQLFGWDTIPATVVDLDSIRRGEFAENVFRLDFTPSALVAIAEEIEREERAQAKQPQGPWWPSR